MKRKVLSVLLVAAMAGTMLMGCNSGRQVRSGDRTMADHPTTAANTTNSPIPVWTEQTRSL